MIFKRAKEKSSTPARIARARLIYDKQRRNGTFNQDEAIIDCRFTQGLNVAECIYVLGSTSYEVQIAIAKAEGL